MPDFSAQESGLGYLYQSRYALWLLLDGPEEQEVVLETLDDIVLSQDGPPRDLLQTKHNALPARLTDASSPLWKTLRIWSTHVKDGVIQVPPTTLTLITTAEAPAASIAAALRPGRDCLIPYASFVHSETIIDHYLTRAGTRDGWRFGAEDYRLQTATARLE